MKSDWINGQTVVVAGATGAIGRATCTSFLARGAKLIALGRDPAKLALLGQGLNATAEYFHQIPVDGSSQQSWEHVLAVALQRGPGIDAFVYAAGEIVPGAFLELTEGEINSIIETNFRSVIRAAGVIVPHMAERGRGHFIVVGSLGGIVPMPYETIYSASKFALRGFCLSLHEEVRHLGVTVSLISPGPVRSPMLNLEGSDLRAALTFVDAPLEPEDIAVSIVRLLQARKREIVRPAWQRIEGMIVSMFPALFGALYPLLAAIGRQRLLRYRRELRNSKGHHDDYGQSIQAA